MHLRRNQREKLSGASVTWDDHAKIKLFMQKMEDGEILTKQEMLEILMVLMNDYWERGLE